MKHSLYLSKLTRRAGLVLLLASLMVLLAVTGLTLAQTSEDEPPGGGFDGGVAPVWLVLDPAESQEEVLPLLLENLTNLKKGGHVIAFETTPQQSAANAVWAVQVTALTHRHSLLVKLPGVLAVVDQLPPPPPPSGQRVQASTVITGRVTQSISPTTPIAGAGVRAYDGITFIWLNNPGVTTDPAGVYSTTVDSPYNQVKVRFTNPGYAEEWYDNKDTFGTADTIATGGAVITGINAQLDQANAALTGTVTLTPGGILLDGALVILYRASDGVNVAGGLTSNGHFTLTGLVSDTYKAEIINGSNLIIAPEFYQDQLTLAAATPINLTSNATATIAMEVARTAVITGQVTDGATMLPITNATHFVTVTVYDQNDNFVIGATVDGPTGVYTAAGFGTGSYKLQFSAVGVPSYQTEYYSDALTLETATLVTATSGLTRNINEDLFLTGAAGITGQVTSFTGTGLVNIDVQLYQLNLTNQTFQFDSLTTTGSNGVYAFSNKSNGQYKVRVGHFDNDIIPHAFAWYTNSGTISNATAIIVSNGITRTGIDVQLELGGCIAGKILNTSGVAQSNAPYSVQDNLGDVVPVFSAAGSANPFFTPSPTSDGSGQGEFLACGLPTGVYAIDCSFGMVSGVNVTAGQLTADIICGGGGNLYLPLIVKP